MLTELMNVAQEWRAPGHRRWFADDELDLIVWYAESGEIFGFQLCYDITGMERAFTWRRNQALMHTGVDSGEQSPLYNRSPLLVSDRNVSSEGVLAEFHARAQQLDPEIVEIVATTLAGFKPKGPA